MKTKLFVLVFIVLCTFTLVAKENTIKKIVLVKDDDGEFFNGVSSYIKLLLKNKGYDESNSVYINLSLKGDLSLIQELKEEIIEIEPDVVFLNLTRAGDLAKSLKGTGVPVVLGGNIDYSVDGRYLYIDKNKNIISNITGMYNFPENFYKDGFSLLNAVSPLKDKKAVLILNPNVWNTDVFVKGLKDLGFPLKKLETPVYWEDVQELVKKYNEDDEVGWILADNAFESRTGMVVSQEKNHRWLSENSKKPNVGYYQVSVENGRLCALAVDSLVTVERMIDMADRILKGTDLKEIEPEYPPKAVVLLNFKRAEMLGIEIPINVIQGSWRVYTDFEGNFIGVE